MLQFLCGLSKLCLIILLFPLRESQDDRKVLANFCSYRFDDRYRKSSALDQRTAIRVARWKSPCSGKLMRFSGVRLPPRLSSHSIPLFAMTVSERLEVGDDRREAVLDGSRSLSKRRGRRAHQRCASRLSWSQRLLDALRSERLSETAPTRL